MARAFDSDVQTNGIFFWHTWPTCRKGYCNISVLHLSQANYKIFALKYQNVEAGFNKTDPEKLGNNSGTSSISLKRRCPKELVSNFSFNAENPTSPTSDVP